MADRFSNYEALRIVAMFSILVHHYSFGIEFDFKPENSGYRWFNHYSTLCLGSTGKIGVNIFLLMTGYFLNGRPMKASSIARTWFQTVTWSYLILLPACFFGKVTKNQLRVALFPVILHEYWYISSYVAAAMCTGLIAAMSQKATPSQYICGLFSLFFVMTLVAWPVEISFCNVLWFIFVISLGSFIRRFQLWFNKIKTVTLLLIFLLATLVNVGSIHYWMNHGSIWNMPHGPHALTANNWSIVPLMYGISLFLLFQRLQFTSKIINKVARCSLGVYLIHENPFVQPILFAKCIGTKVYANSTFLPVINVVTVITLYLLLSFMEHVRHLLLGSLEDRVSYWVGLISQKIAERLDQLDNCSEEKESV